jgi:hypothetical protein
VKISGEFRINGKNIDLEVKLTFLNLSLLPYDLKSIILIPGLF